MNKNILKRIIQQSDSDALSTLFDSKYKDKCIEIINENFDERISLDPSVHYTITYLKYVCENLNNLTILEIIFYHCDLSKNLKKPIKKFKTDKMQMRFYELLFSSTNLYVDKYIVQNYYYFRELKQNYIYIFKTEILNEYCVTLEQFESKAFNFEVFKNFVENNNLISRTFIEKFMKYDHLFIFSLYNNEKIIEKYFSNPKTFGKDEIKTLLDHLIDKKEVIFINKYFDVLHTFASKNCEENVIRLISIKK